ncbi:MAG: cysteine hydrolase [Chloroflexi bacterium]|nr:cysteine hydrolase [Chloroflexota bacterium]
MKELQDIYVNSRNSILVIVDMENEFCKPGGKNFPTAKADTLPLIISAIGRLADRARSAGVPVIHIQSVRTLNEPEFTVFGRPHHLKLGTWGAEIVDELKPRPGEPVIQKYSHDCFYRTGLDDLLQRLVPDPTSCYAIVTGGTVNVCVRHAVFGLYLRDYWTVVPVDGVVYTSDLTRQNALESYSHRAYPNIFLSRSDLIHFSKDGVGPAPVVGK